MTEESLIKGFVHKELMRSAGGTEPEMTDNLIEGGIIDSLGIQKLLAYLENAFGIAVADDELVPANFETIACITAFVKSKVNGKDGKPDKGIYYREPGKQAPSLER